MSNIQIINEENNPLISLRCEMQCIAGLLKYPDILFNLDSNVDSDVFVNRAHKTLFFLLKTEIENGNKKFDKVNIAQKLKDLKITHRDELNIFDYLDVLASQQVNKEGAVESFDILNKLRILRSLDDDALSIRKYIRSNKNKPLSHILSEVDTIHNNKFDILKNEHGKLIDLFETIEEKIEFIANNPPNEKDFMFGPIESMNRIFGSISRPGNITVVGSRSGVGKTSWGMFYNIYLAEKYNIPLVHLDFGEMNPKELQFRAVVMFSKGIVPYWALEQGKWRDNPEWVKIIKEIWQRVKKIKFYYYDISRLKPIEIISLIRRLSYSKFGRGNLFLTHYDYLKPFDSGHPSSPEWQKIGFFLNDIKSFVEGEVNVPFYTSVQLNRSGIFSNKTIDKIDDSENSFSISDRIVHYSSYSLLIRPKVSEELKMEEGGKYGNLKCLFLKNRHLGREYKKVLVPVKISKDKYVKNYINLFSESFWYEDRGDLRTMINELNQKYDTGTEDKKEEDF